MADETAEAEVMGDAPGARRLSVGRLLVVAGVVLVAAALIGGWEVKRDSGSGLAGRWAITVRQTTTYSGVDAGPKEPPSTGKGTIRIRCDGKNCTGDGSASGRGFDVATGLHQTGASTWTASNRFPPDTLNPAEACLTADSLVTSLSVKRGHAHRIDEGRLAYRTEPNQT